MNIKFDTGLKEYMLNDKVAVYFNPTSNQFVNDVYGAVTKLDELTEKYRSEVEAEEDPSAVFALGREMDTEMRAVLNELFDQDICTPLFGKMSVYAAADGLPVWANLLLAIIDEMDDAFREAKEAGNPRIQKYIDKYGKKAGK